MTAEKIHRGHGLCANVFDAEGEHAVKILNGRELVAVIGLVHRAVACVLIIAHRIVDICVVEKEEIVIVDDLYALFGLDNNAVFVECLGLILFKEGGIAGGVNSLYRDFGVERGISVKEGLEIAVLIAVGADVVDSDLILNSRHEALARARDIELARSACVDHRELCGKRADEHIDDNENCKKDQRDNDRVGAAFSSSVKEGLFIHIVIHIAPPSAPTALVKGLHRQENKENCKGKVVNDRSNVENAAKEAIESVKESKIFKRLREQRCKGFRVDNVSHNKRDHGHASNDRSDNVISGKEIYDRNQNNRKCCESNKGSDCRRRDHTDKRAEKIEPERRSNTENSRNKLIFGQR